jgi:hypothetical protein
MLFDLNATRRRRTVTRVIYSVLAVLMAASLFFVINGGVFSNNGGGSSSSSASGATAQALAEVRQAQKATTANPNSASAWANLMQARYRAGESGRNYNPNTGAVTAAGKAQLESALTAWNKYVSLVKTPDLENSQLAGEIYDKVGDFSGATGAWQAASVAEPQAIKTFECLAFAAYASKKTDLGDEAADRAVSLTPKLQRLTVQNAFSTAKKTQSTAKAYAGQEC